MLVFFQKRTLFLGLVLSALVWSVSVSATTMVFSNLERMIEISDIVVQGHVISKKTYVSEAMNNQVVTTTTFETDRVFFGKETKQFSITQWGGQYKGKMANIPGDATFEIGEEAILFLATPKNANEKGHLFLSLLSQSKYSLTRLAGKKMVTRKISTIAFVNPETSKFSKHPNELYQYDAFVAELESQIAAIKGAQK